MNKKILIPIVIIILFALSLFFITKFKGVVQKKPVDIENKGQLLGPTIEEIAQKVANIEFANAPLDWKAYSSVASGIKLAYPYYINYKETTDGISLYFDTPENRALKEGKIYVAPDGGINISNHMPPSLDMTKIKTNATPADLEKKCEMYSAVCKMSTFLGRQAEVSTWEAAEIGDNIYFLSGNDLYAISMTYGLPNDELRATYYQILSTIEFKK